MRETAEAVVGFVPRYVTHFVRIIAEPRSEVWRLVESDDEHHVGAWRFFLVSLVATQLLRGAEGAVTPERAIDLIVGAVALAVYVLTVACLIALALLLVRRSVPFLKVVAVSLYYFSAASVVLAVVVLVAARLEAANPCAAFVTDWGFREVDCEAAMEEAGASGWFWALEGYLSYALPRAATAVLAVWLLYAWFVWRRFREMSVARCLAALGIVLLLAPLLLLLTVGFGAAPSSHD